MFEESAQYYTFNVTQNNEIVYSKRMGPDASIVKRNIDGNICWEIPFNQKEIYYADSTFPRLTILNDNRIIVPLLSYGGFLGYFNESVTNIFEFDIINGDGVKEKSIETKPLDYKCFGPNGGNTYGFVDEDSNICIYTCCGVHELREELLNCVIVLDKDGNELFRNNMVAEYVYFPTLFWGGENIFCWRINHNNKTYMPSMVLSTNNIKTGICKDILTLTCSIVVSAKYYNGYIILSYLDVSEKNTIISGITEEGEILWSKKFVGKLLNIEIINDYLYIATSARIGVYRMFTS